MSVETDTLAVALGLLGDTAIKATIPLLGAGLLGRVLPTASARHATWATAFATVPLLAGVSVWSRGADIGLGGPSALLVLWALGAGLVLSPLLRGLPWLARKGLGGTTEADVVWTDALDVPVTFARTILMPTQAKSWKPEAQRAALLHERAHLARGDWWVHIGAWLVAAALWFHPLVWWARWHLVLEAERAADDRVLAAGIRPSSYAQQLLGMTAGPAAGLSLGRSATPTRVRSVLCPDRARGHRRWPVLLLAGVLGLISTPLLAGWALWVPPPPISHCNPTPGVLP